MKLNELVRDWRFWGAAALVASYIAAGVVAYINRAPEYDPAMVETLIRLHELTGDL